jgi:hypothetical protein
MNSSTSTSVPDAPTLGTSDVVELYLTVGAVLERLRDVESINSVCDAYLIGLLSESHVRVGTHLAHSK